MCQARWPAARHRARRRPAARHHRYRARRKPAGPVPPPYRRSPGRQPPPVPASRRGLVLPPAPQERAGAVRPVVGVPWLVRIGAAPRRAASQYRKAYDLSIDAGDYLDAAWDAASAAAALAYGNHLTHANRLADDAQAAAAASGAPSALALAAWAMGEIAAITDP